MCKLCLSWDCENRYDGTIYPRNEIDRSMVVAEHPIGKIGVPEDVAKAILYLVSEYSSWISGAILPIDGGDAITK
jgi:NAD(P)-dependent dehydrogenase (short-subunit alcohol dehydrogenase family)